MCCVHGQDLKTLNSHHAFLQPRVLIGTGELGSITHGAAATPAGVGRGSSNTPGSDCPGHFKDTSPSYDTIFEYDENTLCIGQTLEMCCAPIAFKFSVVHIGHTFLLS